jgi:hypothetical protein
VSRDDDSGVIDLHAIHAKAQAAKATPAAPLSAPPPAFVTDLSSPSLGEDDGDLALLLRRRDPRKLAFAGAGAAVLIGLFAVLASALGAPAEGAKAARGGGGQAAAAVPSPLPPAAPTTLLATPPPVAASAETVAAAPSPPPPSTGAPRAAAPPKSAAKGARAPSRKVSAGGPKLMKVQSGGVAADPKH